MQLRWKSDFFKEISKWTRTWYHLRKTKSCILIPKMTPMNYCLIRNINAKLIKIFEILTFSHIFLSRILAYMYYPVNVTRHKLKNFFISSKVSILCLLQIFSKMVALWLTCTLLVLVDFVVVQLWTVNNYHWYLKQQIEFPASLKNRVACFIWDPEVPLRLHILTRGGSNIIIINVQYFKVVAFCTKRPHVPKGGYM